MNKSRKLAIMGGLARGAKEATQSLMNIQLAAYKLKEQKAENKRKNKLYDMQLDELMYQKKIRPQEADYLKKKRNLDLKSKEADIDLTESKIKEKESAAVMQKERINILHKYTSNLPTDDIDTTAPGSLFGDAQPRGLPTSAPRFSGGGGVRGASFADDNSKPAQPAQPNTSGQGSSNWKITKWDLNKDFPTIENTGKNMKSIQNESVKQSSKTVEQAAIQTKNFNKSVALFRGLISQIKAKGKEQGGLGLIPGIKGKIATKLKVPGYGATEAFEGQRKETALALNNVITGQNRAIKSIVDMIFSTLPDEYDPEDFAATKTAQSITNAYKLKKAVDNAMITPSDAEKMSTGQLKLVANNMELSTEEQAEIEEIMQSVLSTEAAPKRTLTPDWVPEGFDYEGAINSGLSEEHIQLTLKKENII